MKLTFFVTLNWNTTSLCEAMIRSVDQATPEPHPWIILDNGSRPDEYDRLRAFLHEHFLGRVCLVDLAMGGAPEGGDGFDCLLLRSPENLGCVLGHNRCFDEAERWARGRPFDIVMLDTDVEVFEDGWLTKVNEWAERESVRQPVGIVGLEHGRDMACAGAVFLDPSGNWYLHQTQMYMRRPCMGESAGLGFALIRHPITTLRFDPEFRIYYKQDDDLCFQSRLLGYEVWAYPVDNVHYGSGSLKVNDYQVNEHKGWDAFHAVKSANQALFAKKWAWALKDRRPNLAAEEEHLDRMRLVMEQRRYGGL